MGRENIFKPTVGNESLHQDSNDNGDRLVNFATSKNLIIKSKMFPRRDINMCTWTHPDRKTQSQFDHILKDRRWNLSILHARNFRGADFDTDHHLVVAKVKERLAVNKQAAQKFNGIRFNFRKLNELEVRKQFKIEILNRFATLDNLPYSEYINRVWVNIIVNIKISA